LPAKQVTGSTTIHYSRRQEIRQVPELVQVPVRCIGGTPVQPMLVPERAPAAQQ
jgi:hypothetical protein